MNPAKSQKFAKGFRQSWQLYVLLAPCIVYFIIFHYLPIYGVQIAFRDYKAVEGITSSVWVGWKHFQTFFHTYYFQRLLVNTFLLNLYGLLWGFPIPVILAIFLNRIRGKRFKRFAQTAIYVPHFISTVVLAGMLYIFLSPTSGIVNTFIQVLGGKPIDFMVEQKLFRSIYISSGIWQNAGWGTILYLATLTGIDPGLYEAAEIDGASIWQKIWYIDVPSLLPIVAMNFILSCGGLLGSNTDKTLLLQTAGNISTSDVIGVYVYNVGLGQAKYSYTAAIGLFTNIISFFMIIFANTFSKKVAKISMF